LFTAAREYSRGSYIGYTRYRTYSGLKWITAIKIKHKNYPCNRQRRPIGL
jgi:hypothetical protein